MLSRSSPSLLLDHAQSNDLSSDSIQRMPDATLAIERLVPAEDQRCLSTTRCRSIESLSTIERIRHLRSTQPKLRIELYRRTERTDITQ